MVRKEVRVLPFKDEFDDADFKELRANVRDLSLRLARLEEQVATMENGDYNCEDGGDYL